VPNECHILTRVRHAASTLEPATIDLGPEQVQFCSYFDRVTSAAANKQLILQPIAAILLPREPTGPVSITVSDSRDPWTLVCRSVRPISDHAASVDLDWSRIVDHPDSHRRRAISGPHQLALVAPHGVQQSDAHVFPIVEIDASSCVVDATTPFELGQQLSVVEIVGDQQVLRRCTAVVCAINAFCTADGSRRFRCTLDLHDELTSLAGESSEIVSDPTRLRRVVEFAALSSVCGLYDVPGWHRGTARFVEANRDSLMFALFPVPEGGPGPQFIKVSFSLFGVESMMTLRVLELNGAWIRTALPLCLRRSRSFAREQDLPHGAQSQMLIRFRNPVSGDYDEHLLSRVSIKKLAFELDAPKHLLWQGLPLENASLHWPDGDTQLGELRVETIAAHGSRKRVEVSVLSASGQQELTRLVSKLHPSVSVHDGSNFRTFLTMYKQAGLFAPHMRSNLDPILPQAKRLWHAMHQPGLEVVQTFVHGPQDAPDAALTVVRHWEHAWLSQHFVSVGQQFSGGTGQLQLAVLDYIQRRPDGQYYMFFVKSDNRQMNAFLERFLATTGTPEATERRTIQFWRRLGSLPAWQTETRNGLRVHDMRPAQEKLVSRGAERVLGIHGTNGLSLVPGEFHLPNTAKRFAQVGITRGRHCSVVSQGRVALWSIVEEITSQGFNLTWMLNASWLLPVHAGNDPERHGLRLALQHILQKPAQSPTGDMFINTVEEADAAVLEEAGFEKLADVHMYTLNRAGLNRYFQYTSDRYSEVDLRTQQRRVRRSGIQVRSGAAETAAQATSRDINITDRPRVAARRA
jgi:hypothetical protein